MSNLTQSEREGLNELFCQLQLANIPLHKRILLRLNHLLVLIKTHLMR
ncbi:hypothetical protein [Hydrogenimonas urashimensis]|nr:hypothetical protein [Hydrogenimonas urashimensis]